MILIILQGQSIGGIDITSKQIAKICKKQEGVIIIEACITVTAFTILMFFFVGFFVLFASHNAITNALLETSMSLSLDSYATSKIKNSMPTQENYRGVGGWIGEVIVKQFFGNEYSNPHYISDSTWYSDGGYQLETAIRNRFVGYLSGNVYEADRFLKGLRIKNGLNGVDFSESSIENGDLIIRANYTFEFLFRLGTLTDIDATQKYVSRLWMKDASLQNASIN